MKAAFIHPLRHHAYSTVAGMGKYCDTVAYLGFYNRNDLLDKILSRTRFAKLVEGYSLSEINANVKSSYYIKLLFLLYKANPKKFESFYFSQFQKWVEKDMIQYDVIHFVQDYCNHSIRKASEMGKTIIYEQIMPFDSLQKQIIQTEMQKFGYENDYASLRFPTKKIKDQEENIKLSHYFIGASKETTESLKQFVGDKKIFTLPLGTAISPVNEARLHEKYISLKEERAVRCLYVGAHNLLKGTHYIVEAAKQMSNENVKFSFVGKPQFPEDSEMIEKIKSMTNTEYIRSIPHVEMRDFYLNYDIFIFQGLCEGFGIVTLEAMACGLPCLVSEGGCGVVTHKFDGFINENRDVDSLVERIRYLNKNRCEIERMGRNAYGTAQRHTWKAYCDSVTDAYCEMFV